MSIPGNRGYKLALHLLAVMSQIHYCVITKTKIYYSHPSFNSPSDVNIALVYLGNSIFRDTTTLAKKCPPPPYINMRETFPGDFTPQESHLSNREKNGTRTSWTPRNVLIHRTSRKNTNPLPIRHLPIKKGRIRKKSR